MVTLHAPAQSPDSLYLNLERLLEIGGANNLTIEQYRLEQEKAMADMAREKAWWLPELYAGGQTHKYNGAAMNTDGRFYPNTDRGNLWTGVGAKAKWDFGEGIYQSKAAKHKAKAASYQTQAERNKALLKTIEAYYDLLTAQLYNSAYEEMARQADTIVGQLQTQVGAGMRFESEALLAKSNRNHLYVRQLEAENDYVEMENRMTNLLDLEPGTKVIGVDSALVPLELIPEQEWQSYQGDSTFQDRPEYQYLKWNMQAIRTSRKSTTTGLFLPELQMETYGSYFGGLFETIRPVDPAAYPDPQMLYPTTMINVSLMWRLPLGRFTHAGRLKQHDAEIALQENKIHQFENQVNEEVNNARSQLRTANKQLKLAVKAQEQAKEAVQQSIQRQKLGTAKPFEVFQSQEFFLRAKLDYLNAIASYNKAQYRLYVALGNDL